MLGGYIGAGPRKLLERDMVFIFRHMLFMIRDMVFVFNFRTKTLKYFFPQVLVSLQYRVGPLGFLCLPDDEIAGNVGLMDQVQKQHLLLHFSAGQCTISMY